MSMFFGMKPSQGVVKEYAKSCLLVQIASHASRLTPAWGQTAHKQFIPHAGAAFWSLDCIRSTSTCSWSSYCRLRAASTPVSVPGAGSQLEPACPVAASSSRWCSWANCQPNRPRASVWQLVLPGGSPCSPWGCPSSTCRNWSISRMMAA